MTAAVAFRFAERLSVAQVELGLDFAPKFDADGLIPAIVIDDGSRAILMLGYMNAEAIERTIVTGDAHFWSRSRRAIWHKGEHSGFTQKVSRILIDDDQDALIIEVVLDGPGSCHVGYSSCFYRAIDLATAGQVAPPRLVMIEDALTFDAQSVYSGLPNPTKL